MDAAAQLAIGEKEGRAGANAETPANGRPLCFLSTQKRSLHVAKITKLVESRSRIPTARDLAAAGPIDIKD